MTGRFKGLFIVIAVLISACGGANRTMENDPRYRQIVEEVSDLEFEIENEWANPTQYQRVNLIGNPNRIKFENDTVEVYLPFFGERYVGGAYDRDGGAIQFEGKPENLDIREDRQKGAVIVSFEGNRKSENLDFIITIFKNGVARTIVRSSQRETISYDGKLINR